jgi:NhaP-type Na+/H+ or K+/H+ antiporter
MPLNLAFVAILLGGWLAGRLFSKIGLPAVLGMAAWGISLKLLSGDQLPPLLHQLEPFLKSFALIVILLRAGLGISKRVLAKVGRTAILMSVLPCLIEGAALTVTIHLVFGFDWAIAGLTAFMLAAVSPAVIVPSMLTLKEAGYGRRNEVPTIVLAGASVDDVFAITLFTLFVQAAGTQAPAVAELLVSIPVTLVLGIVPGVAIGFLLVRFFKRPGLDIRATEKMLLLLLIAVVLVQFGDWIHGAALLGVMAIGFILLEKAERIAHEMAVKLAKLWVVAEILLFVLIGLAVDPLVALEAGLPGLLAITIGLVFRSLGVWLATWRSALSRRERLFCVIAYFPKATVQAALGGVALASGIAHGETILAIALLAIVFTAPLGLLGIRYFGKKLLDVDFDTA